MAKLGVGHAPCGMGIQKLAGETIQLVLHIHTSLGQVYTGTAHFSVCGNQSIMAAGPVLMWRTEAFKVCKASLLGYGEGLCLDITLKCFNWYIVCGT